MAPATAIAGSVSRIRWLSSPHRWLNLSAIFKEVLKAERAYAFLDGGELALDGNTIPVYYGLGAASDIFQLKPGEEAVYALFGEDVSGVQEGNTLEIPTNNGDYSIPIIDKIPKGKKILLHNSLVELDQGIYINLPFDVFQEVTGRTSSSFFSLIELPNDLRFIDLTIEERREAIQRVETDQVRVMFSADSHVSSILGGAEWAMILGTFTLIGVFFVIIAFVVSFQSFLNKHRKEFLIQWMYGATKAALSIRLVHTVAVAFFPAFVISYVGIWIRYEEIFNIPISVALIAYATIVGMTSFQFIRKLKLQDHLIALRGGI